MNVPKLNRKDQRWTVSNKANVHSEFSNRRVPKTDKVSVFWSFVIIFSNRIVQKWSIRPQMGNNDCPI